MLLVADTNGHTDEHVSMDSAAVPVSTGEDDEMKDADESRDTSAIEPTTTRAAASGTPASTRVTTNGSTKKKSSAVPEHRSKKLNKKKSKPTLRLDAEPGQLYLARLKGHPAWPSMICDEEMLPASLLKSRPITTAQPDGSFKKPDYAEGGKRAAERTFPIMFLYVTFEISRNPLTNVFQVYQRIVSYSDKPKT